MENKRINSFFRIDKRWVNIKTWQHGCLSHNNEMKCDFWIDMCTLRKWEMNILQIIWLFILKKNSWKFSYDWIIW